jgi:exonuclease III
MTMTTSDPPVTVVCAYLPFCNPLTEDIAPRCSTFRTHFTSYIAELANNMPHRQRSLIIGGDLQVALTDRNESVTLIPPSPGSTDQERMDHANLVSTAHLIDSYRALRPDGRGHTCRTTYPQWTRGRALASERIDYILSPMQGVRSVSVYCSTPESPSGCFTVQTSPSPHNSTGTATNALRYSSSP